VECGNARREPFFSGMGREMAPEARILAGYQSG
jgi:hypothetical protein